jgi:hypothetical protein
MTLDKHQIDGLPGFTQKTMPANEFEKLMGEADYEKAGSGQGQTGRVKIWWSYKTIALSNPFTVAIKKPS